MEAVREEEVKLRGLNLPVSVINFDGRRTTVSVGHVREPCRGGGR